MTLKSMALAAGTVMSLVLSSSAWTADVQTMAVDAAKNQAVETAKDQATGTVKGHANKMLPTTGAVPSSGAVDATKSVKDAAGGKAGSAAGMVSGNTTMKKATEGVTGTVKDQATDVAKDKATDMAKDKASSTVKDVIK